MHRVQAPISSGFSCTVGKEQGFMGPEGVWSRMRLAIWASLARLLCHCGLGCKREHCLPKPDTCGAQRRSAWGNTTCVHFSPSALVLRGAGEQHPCKSHHQPALAAPQWVSVLESTRDTAQQNILCFQPTAVLGAGGSSAAIPAATGEQQKALRQVLNGDSNKSGTAGHTQHCPSLVCCWPQAPLRAVSA